MPRENTMDCLAATSEAGGRLPVRSVLARDKDKDWREAPILYD